MINYFKNRLNRLPRRLRATAAEVKEIQGVLHLRAQLSPGDPNKLAIAEGASNSWGGAIWWVLGCYRQDSPISLALGMAGLAFVLIGEPVINLFR